jgi:hypothetical protein
VSSTLGYSTLKKQHITHPPPRNIPELFYSSREDLPPPPSPQLEPPPDLCWEDGRLSKEADSQRSRIYLQHISEIPGCGEKDV